MKIHFACSKAHRSLLSVGLPMAAAMIAQVGAATVVYTDRNDYLAALPSTYEDDFNDLATGTHTAPMSRGEGNFAYEIHVYNELWWETGNLSTRTAGGSIGLSTPSAYNNIEFAFASGEVNAFGGYFWGSDYMGESYSGAIMTFGLSDGSQYTIEDISGTSTFVGFISDDETWDWIYISSFPDRPSFDNLIIGSTVPEPSTITLLSTFGLIGLLRRKRRN